MKEPSTYDTNHIRTIGYEEDKREMSELLAEIKAYLFGKGISWERERDLTISGSKVKCTMSGIKDKEAAGKYRLAQKLETLIDAQHLRFENEMTSNNQKTKIHVFEKIVNHTVLLGSNFASFLRGRKS